MNETCDCCEGTHQLTPKTIANRPGLDALAYRVGTHAAFLETMKARLSSMVVEIPGAVDPTKSAPTYPLRSLTTRAPYDPSIALLDAWATVGGVLTFYQERIANEGYLRTATERRSILELARLVGYSLRPGVASTAYLAFTMDNNFKEETVIPAGTRAQSAPGPDELPQSFETSEPITARASWNNLEPRLLQPQSEDSIKNVLGEGPRVYLKGINTNLQPNDPLLIDFGKGNTPVLCRVLEVKPDAEADHTLVTLRDLPPDHQPATAKAASAGVKPFKEYAAAFSSATDTEATQFPDLALKFAGDLLKTFAALAKAPPSSDRDEAITETLSDLKELRDILKSNLELD